MDFVNKYELFLFDMDGVIYIGNKTLPGAVRTVNYLKDKKKKVYFLTNNPARSQSEYARKLKDIGIKTDPDHIITSTRNLCNYLERNIKSLGRKTAYLIGSSHFKSSVSRTGIKSVKPGGRYKAHYVIMGGYREFNFKDIDNATQFLRNGAELIATNRDSYYPSDVGYSPGTGALLSSVEISGGTKAVVTGKPEKFIFHLSLELAGVKNKKKTVIIGDNLNTDIAGGNNFGITTVLSLTGVTDKRKLRKSAVKPEYVIDNLSGLLK